MKKGLILSMAVAGLIFVGCGDDDETTSSSTTSSVASSSVAASVQSSTTSSLAQSSAVQSSTNSSKSSIQSSIAQSSVSSASLLPGGNSVSSGASSVSSKSSTSSVSSSSTGDGVAQLTWSQNKVRNTSGSTMYINNIIVDYTSVYSLYGISITTVGTLDTLSGVSTITSSGVTSTTNVKDKLNMQFPYTLKPGEEIDLQNTTQNTTTAGATGKIDYLYTFKTSNGDIKVTAQLTF